MPVGGLRVRRPLQPLLDRSDRLLVLAKLKVGIRQELQRDVGIMRVALHIGFEIFDGGRRVAGEYLDMRRHAQALSGIGRQLKAALRFRLRAIKVPATHISRPERKMAV